MREFVIPNTITLAGVKITVKHDETLDDVDSIGLWVASRNEILINPHVPTGVQYRAFVHELAEAICYLFVNSPETGNKVPHETVDGFGMGIFNLLIDNAHLIIKESNGTP